MKKEKAGYSRSRKEKIRYGWNSYLIYRALLGLIHSEEGMFLCLHFCVLFLIFIWLHLEVVSNIFFLTKGPCSFVLWVNAWLPLVEFQNNSWEFTWTQLISRWPEYSHLVFSSLQCMYCHNYVQHSWLLFHLRKIKTRQIVWQSIVVI